MKTLRVRAAVGLRFPRHDDPRKHITADEVVEVPSNTHYRRAVKRGDLLVVEQESKRRAAPRKDEA